MKYLLLILTIFLICIAPITADKYKGLISGDILQADLDAFTGNTSDIPSFTDNDSSIRTNLQDINEWIDIGKTLLKSDNWASAGEAFSKVIERDPGNEIGWEGYLLSIRGEGDFYRLLAATDDGEEKNPGYALIWIYKGIALNGLDRSNEALSAFDKAREIDPSNYMALYYKGLSLVDLQRYDEAVSAFKLVVEADPEYVKAWNNLGVALNYLEKYDEAITAFDRAYELDPSFSQANDNKAIAVEEQKSKKQNFGDAFDDALSLSRPQPTITVVPAEEPANNEVPTIQNTPVPTPSVLETQYFYGIAEFNGYPLRVGDRVMATCEGIDLSTSTNPVSVVKFGEYGDPIGKEMLTVDVPNGELEQHAPISFWIKPQDFEYWYRAEVKNQLSSAEWSTTYPFSPGSITNLDIRSSDRADFMYFDDIVATIGTVILPDDHTGW